MSAAEVRHAARAVILDPDDRILLVRWVKEDLGVDIWLTPGGGIDEGEDAVAALRRELREETGLRSYDPGPTIWTRRDSFPWYARTVDQSETFVLVRVPAFEPRPDPAAIDAEGVARGALVDARGARGVGRDVRARRTGHALARAARARPTAGAAGRGGVGSAHAVAQRRREARPRPRAHGRG